MSFDEQAAKSFLEGEGEFDEQAAQAFLSGNVQQEPSQDPEMALQQHLAKPPQGEPEPQYGGLDKYLWGKEGMVAEKPPELLRLAGEWGTAGTSAVLDAMGMPADALNWALNKVGIDAYAPVGGKELRKAGEKIGIAYTETPDTPAARAGEYTALGLEFLAAPLMLAKKATMQALSMGKTVLPGASTTAGITQQISAPFYTAGKTALGAELTASTASGIGAYYGGKEFGQTGEMIGGILGGFSSVPIAIASPYVARMVHRSGLLQLVGGVLGKIPGVSRIVDVDEGKRLLELGGKLKASDRVRQLAETADVATAIAREQGNILPGAKVSPAKLSGDRHLIALENEVLKTDPSLAHKLIMQDFENNKLAIEELKRLGGTTPVTKTQAYLRGKINHVTELVRAKVDQALAKASDSLKDVSPMMRRRAVNTTIKANLDDALSKARNIEGEWWGKVKQDTIVPTATTRKTFIDEISQRAEAADPEDIPQFIYQYLGKIEKGQVRDGKWGASQTVKEMQAFRSRITDAMRNEKAKDAPNWNKVRILDDTQEAILSDLAAAKTETGVEEAIAYSRALNEKFRGGVMDQIFGNKKTGGKVAPELSVSSIKSGPKAAVDMEKIIKASPDSKPVLEELMKLNIVHSKAINVRTGRVNVPMAKRYMEENEDVFNLFPELKRNMDAAIGLEERAIGTTAIAKARLEKIARSPAARIAEAKPQRVWTEIINSPNPRQAVRKAMNRSNDIGKRGIKNDAVGYLLNKRARTSSVDDEGIPLLSGKKLKNELLENKALYSEIFNKDEFKRLNMIAETMAKTEGFSKLPEVGGVISPRQGLLSYGIVTMAARLGAILGHGTSGASLRTASMASRVAQAMVDQLDVGQAQKILRDAVTDHELYKSLFTDVTNPVEWAKAHKVIHGWMVAHAIESLEEQ